jgi:hypothetical protein
VVPGRVRCVSSLRKRIRKGSPIPTFISNVTDFHRFWDIFWIDASNQHSVERDIIQIAKHWSGTYEETKLMAAKDWFSIQDNDCLMIFDNADDILVVYSNYLPTGSHGSVLMTTRNDECREYQSVGFERFEKLKLPDAVELLYKVAEAEYGSGKDIDDGAERLTRNLANTL